MQLIDEIEISYFRSFYKFKFRDLHDLNIIYGKNDSGKSNLVRALNLFFSGYTEYSHPFDFNIDFCDRRLLEAEQSEDVRKFLYVKITFNTPKSYTPSLGEKFYVKRQWTVSRGLDYHEEVSASIPNNRRHIVTRLLNRIRFIYVPAIKDLKIFEFLLSSIHETIALSPAFVGAVDKFSAELQGLTSSLFETLPKDVSTSTKIGAPTQLSQLFQTLDFETISRGESTPKSLTRQRGDGIKVRHIPELLNFISEKDRFDYHIWGFEEPENSLDFGAAQSEAQRILSLSKGDQIQVFMTTHSPSFYLLDDPSVRKCYISKDETGSSVALQGKELEKLDPSKAIQEGFYLPAVAKSLERLADYEREISSSQEEIAKLNAELVSISSPVILTEGRTDALILGTAWRKLRGTEPQFRIRSCETGGENAGSGNGGATKLSVRLKGIPGDHPHAVLGLFDFDKAGIAEYSLDRNFVDMNVGPYLCKRAMHGRAYAALLPAPHFREECFRYKNMPIEFLFEDEYLLRNVNGYRLELTRKKASTMVGDIKVEFELDDETHFKDIRGGKNEFASIIVPTFPPEAFRAFDSVFQMFELLIQDNAERQLVSA